MRAGGEVPAVLPSLAAKATAFGAASSVEMASICVDSQPDSIDLTGNESPSGLQVSLQTQKCKSTIL